MASSLSEQLRNLALPQSDLLQRSKKRASLLFDPKEASGFKRETIYQIGLDGLEELINKDQQFEQYQNTLFHVTSKKFERSMQTAESNRKLNKTIRKFLLHLSPYLLLNCAHKALEWLINRYSIHDFNREDLLMLILPYHESNIFVRIVQLMKFKDHNDSWFFLKTLQKNGVPLTKLNLLSHAASDPHFLKFVGHFVALSIKYFEKPQQLTVAFNFYCAVFTGAIEYSDKLNELQITHMMPALLKGLNSDIPDYCAASYVILGRLVMKTSLTDDILNIFVDKISEAKVENLKTESVLMLLILYQSQEHYVDIPEEACAKLVEKNWLPKVVQDLKNGRNHVAPFLKPLFKGCLYGGVKEENQSHRELLIKLLAALKFDDELLESFLSILLGNTTISKDHPEPVQKWLTELLQTLERQYPEQFDKAIHAILSTREGKATKKRKSLQKILNRTLTMRYKFDVLDKLYHPNASFRTEALGFLVKNFDSLRECEKEMIKSSLIDRLNDDDVTTVRDTLKLIKNASVLSAEVLQRALIKLSYKCQSDLEKWEEVSKDVVLLLCDSSSDDSWQSFVALLPYLLPLTEKELGVTRQVRETTFVKNHVLLGKLDGNTKSCEEFCLHVFNALRNNKVELVRELLEDIRKAPLQDLCVLNKYMVTLILACILPQDSTVQLAEEVVQEVVKIFHSCESKPDKENFQRHITLARSGYFSVTAFLMCLQNIILKTRTPKVELGRLALTDDTPLSRYFVCLAQAIFQKSPLYKKYVSFFLDRFCKDLRGKLEFVLNWAACGESPDTGGVSLVFRLLRQGSDQEVGALFETGDMLLPLALTMLLEKSEAIKRKMFEVVRILVEKTKDGVTHRLLVELLSHHEEIMVNSDQVSLVLAEQFSSPSTKELLKSMFKGGHPIYLQMKVLQLLSRIDNVEVFEETARRCLGLITNGTICDNIKSAIIHQTVVRFQEKMAPHIGLDTAVWQLLQASLKNDELVITINEKPQFVAVLLLEQLDRDFFNKLGEEVKMRFFDLVVERATLTKNAEVLSAVKHFVKVIELDSKLVLPYIVALKDVQSPKLDQTKLRRRISVVPTVDILDTLEWKKGVTVLEFVQDKKKLYNINLILPSLFTALKKCLDFDEQVAVEYPKQLLLWAILDLSGRTPKEDIVENTFNLELIVQCIRASQNPQTHHCALMLLSFSADLFPMQVLHNIMAIFTFMGSSLLRHEDAYSFQILTKTIDTIIPVVVKKGDPQTVARVLRVFVDVILDVPEHRRMRIYVQLLTKVGTTDYLYVFLLLLFESHVNHDSNKKDGDGKRLDIAASICREFPPKVVLQNCVQLLLHLKELPDELVSDHNSTNFEIQHRTPKHFRHYKYTLVSFTARLLASREFVMQVATLSDHTLLELEQIYKEMIIHVLTYIHRVSKVFEKNSTTPQFKYWKVILHLSYDILDSVNAILTPQMFLLVIKGLMVHNYTTVRRRSIELLNLKLQNNSNFFAESPSEDIYSLIPPLLSTMKNIEDLEADSDEELIVQTSLLSLKLLVKFLISDHHEKLLEILNFLADLAKSRKIHNNVLASILLCLAELICNLRAHAIPSLPHLMPILIKILKQQNKEDGSSLLLLSSVTAVQKIVLTLPLFLSPYLEKLFYELSLLSTCWKSSDEKVQPIVAKLTTLRQQIGTSIPLRVLIVNLGQSYEKLISKNEFASVIFLTDVLVECLQHLQVNEINTNLPELTNFFLNALEFRTRQTTQFDQVDEVEAQIITALTKLVLKLSEGTFKPLYYKLYDWAVRHEEQTEKLITFYALSAQIAESLKSLFVSFAGHFLNNAAKVLDLCNNSKVETLPFDIDKTVFLLKNVLKTLLNVFRYDNQKFVNKDRFQILMQPLVDQLENTLDNNLEEVVTPTIVQFVVATADDYLWKQLNYQILLKMKHNSPEIRLRSLGCLKDIVKSLGVDYLPLLPEAIPVLAELLEDEEESVEKACRKAIQEMEKVLGEPIEKYF